TGTVTNNGTIELEPTSNYVYLVFHGNVTLAGTGRMLIDPKSSDGYYAIAYPDTGSTVSNAAGHTVHSVGLGYFGAYFYGTVVNQGVLEVDGPGHFLEMYPGSLRNQGVLKATDGGSLVLASSGGTFILDNTGGQVLVDASTLYSADGNTVKGG